MTTALEATNKDFETMMEMLCGALITQIAGAVASYSIADHLAKGPATAEQISALEQTETTATFRLLRACASLGLATYDGQRFSATPLLSTLRKNVPGSLHSLAKVWSAPGHWLSWGKFADAVRTGQAQAVPALGVETWEYFAREAKEGALFTEAMHGYTSGLAREVARVVDLSSARLAADIGGASGTLVHVLMMAYPQLHGIVLDLPEVVASARTAASDLGLDERSTAMAGDFFAGVPEADVYLLKHVLHDWNDEESVRILEQCRAAMRPAGRVIVIEALLGEMGEPGIAPLMDLNMMVMLTGRERTLTEFRDLLQRAGLQLTKSTAIQPPISVIEAAAI